MTPEPAPDRWLKRAQVGVALVAGMVGAAVPLGTALWRTTEAREALRARITVLESRQKATDARLERVVDAWLVLRQDVSELKGRR